MSELGNSRAQWRKSTYSSGNGQCVEVATLAQTVAIRDSKAPHQGRLVVSHDEWTALLSQIKAGRFG
jgi:Domain of unknown function (DUF397)